MPEFSDHFPLKKARTHEVYGPNALAFGAALAGQVGGVVMWISESRSSEQLNPVGLSDYFEPSNLLLSKVKNQDEGLAIAEESLRSSAVSLVVVELSKPLSFTAGRRLQLAAEVGGAVGLCIIPKGMGNNAAETRWHCAPVFNAKDSTLQRWALKKNKSGTISVWDVKWDAKTRRIIVVSEAAQ